MSNTSKKSVSTYQQQLKGSRDATKKPSNESRGGGRSQGSDNRRRKRTEGDAIDDKFGYQRMKGDEVIFYFFVCNWLFKLQRHVLFLESTIGLVAKFLANCNVENKNLSLLYLIYVSFTWVVTR